MDAPKSTVVTARPTWRTVLLLVWTAVSVPGCHHAERFKKHQACRPAASRAAPTVDVVGAVYQPGTLEVPAEGLPLDMVLARCGGIRCDEAVASQPLFIGVQRGRNAETFTTYFPRRLVEAGPAGQVIVRPNDIVRLVPMSHTRLNDYQPGLTGPGQKFAVRGMVDRPGLFTMGQGEQGLFTLNTAVTAAQMGPTPQGVEPDVMVLSRVAVSGLGIDQYVIPINPSLLDERPLAILPISAAPASGAATPPSQTSPATAAPAVTPTVTTEKRGDVLFYGHIGPGVPLDVPPSQQFRVRRGDPDLPGGKVLTITQARQMLLATYGPATPPVTPPKGDGAPATNRPAAIPALSGGGPVSPTSFAPVAGVANTTIWMRAGDEVLATRLELIPSVLEGIVARIAREETERERCRLGGCPTNETAAASGQPAKAAEHESVCGPLTRSLTNAAHRTGKTLKQLSTKILP